MGPVIIDNAVYRAGRRVAGDLEPGDLAGVRATATEPGDFVWVGLFEPTEAELDAVARIYHLHPLAVEDALRAHQRPKLERYDDSLFLVLKTLWYVDAEDAVETGEISLFVGESFVVSVRHGQGSALHEARVSLEGAQKVLQHGPSAVVYQVCDLIVDQYAAVADAVVEDVDEVEASVFSGRRTRDAERIYVLKRELSEMRRAVLPLRDPVNRFAQGAARGIDIAGAPYFRDVADHLNRVSETIDVLDDLLSTAFDAHLAQISVQQNDDMRKISAVVGLVAGPTLIAGIYGMNFALIPANDSRLGFYFALGLMAALVIWLWVLFKKSGWL